MIQVPILVGLKLCKETIVEEKSKNVSLINCFQRLYVPSFPSPFQLFKICAVLTDGMGETEMSISIERRSSMRTIYERTWQVNFSDPSLQRWVLLTVSRCSFPEAGGYRAILWAEQEEVLGQTTFDVLQ